MLTRELLTPAQRLRLDALPVDLDDRLMARHHTLSEADVEIVSRRRTETNRLGFGVQLCLLRYPGRPLRPKEAAPEKIVRYVAAQLGADPRAMDSYAGGVGTGARGSADGEADGKIGGKSGRDTTRREHLSEIVTTFGFRHFGEGTRGGSSPSSSIPFFQGASRLVGVAFDKLVEGVHGAGLGVRVGGGVRVHSEGEPYELLAAATCVPGGVWIV